MHYQDWKMVFAIWKTKKKVIKTLAETIKTKISKNGEFFAVKIKQFKE